MLIKWNESRVLVATDPKTKKAVKILPGVNEISDDLMKNGLAKSLDYLFKAKRLEKIQATITVKEGKKNPDTGKKEADSVEVKAKAFKDLAEKDQSELIAETFNLEQLAAWKNETSKESVRLEIMKRIELVEEKGAKAKG